MNENKNMGIFDCILGTEVGVNSWWDLLLEWL